MYQKLPLVLPAIFVLQKLQMATQTRGTCWSVTINNPTKSDDEWIALARQKSGWKVYGQREKGAEGTEHYQLMVTTPQVRFSALKKAFPRAHIELARDRTALSKYVQKEDTKVGELADQQEHYPSHTKLMAMFGEYYDTYAKVLGHECFNVLECFDLMIRQKITQGYYVETMGVNPQIRSAIKNYGRSIAQRERSRRQTDRQTTENNVEVDDITNAVLSSYEGSESESEGEGQEGCERSSSSASSCSGPHIRD